MNADGCPELETLERLLLGDLPEPKCESLNEHLMHCDECLSRAETVSPSDEVTEAIRTHRPINGDEEALAKVIERGKQLRSEASTAHLGQTLEVEGPGKSHPDNAPNSSVSQDVAEDERDTWIALLQPAEQPDELGRLGGYRVLEVMGAGGMGVVFRAEDPKLKRLVALKAMKPVVAASKSARERFLREAQSTASIEHDNIVSIFQVGEDNSIPFMAMQLLRGESLQSRIKRDGKLDQAEVVRIGSEIAAGLSAAHARDMIHRDIKPDNIWIEESSGRVKILDFGLVRSACDDADLTQSGIVLGTPRYMAPEQAQGLEVDHRSDLFSLGSVLYHLASGRPAFEGGNLTAILLAVAHKDPEPIQATCPDLNPHLAELIMRLLNKDVDERPQAADEVADALLQMASGAGLIAGPNSVDAGKTIDWKTRAKHGADPKAATRKPLMAIVAVVAVSLGLFFALWAAGVIFNVETKFGIVRIEISGSGKPIEVNVAEDKTIQITDPNDGQPIMVTVDRDGEQLRLDKKGFQVVTKKFSLESSSGRRIVVSFIPNKTEQANAGPTGDVGEEKASPAGTVPPVTSAEDARPKGDPRIITVARDGSGRCTTILEALNQVKPGMTIQVIDDATYYESLILASESRHRDVTLEATHGATIALPPQAVGIFMVRNIEGLTIRGFKLRLTKSPSVGCVVLGKTSRLTLEKVKFLGLGDQESPGVSLEGLSNESSAPNILIRNCEFEKLGIAVRISGIQNDYTTPMTCRGVFVVDSRFNNNFQAITLAGDVRDVLIAGNQVSESTATGIQLQNLVPGAKNIQVLNNSLFKCFRPVQLWDTVARGENIRFLNNLTLDSDAPDWVFVDNGGTPNQAKGFGDGPSVVQKWKLAYNWRDGETPEGGASNGRIPPASKDVVRTQIEVTSRDPEAADFLRPKADSPLASEGAGNVDPRLPAYVGARPPKGVRPWDWRRNWLAPPSAGDLLTVSQNPNDKSQHETIIEALKAAKPWSTIRVLDDATYPRPLQIDDREQHRGIVLEAMNNAQIPGLLISDVPDVIVRGFRVRTTPSIGYLINVRGKVEGGLLESLDIEDAPHQGTSILVTNVQTDSHQSPFVIRKCRLSGGQAISIRGSLSRPTRGVVAQENQIAGCGEGIEIQGMVHDTQLVGNTIQDCQSGGIDLQNLSPESRGILIANNTVFRCGVGLAIFDPEPYEDLAAGQVEVAGNLVFQTQLADMVHLRQAMQSNTPFAVDGRQPIRLWRFHGNWRDLSGREASAALAVADDDHSHSTWNFASRESGNGDYMRPLDEELLTGGAGGDLPGYAGAIAPKDAEPWDWNAVWRGRVSRHTSAPREKVPSE